MIIRLLGLGLGQWDLGLRSVSVPGEQEAQRFEISVTLQSAMATLNTRDCHVI